MRRAAGLVLPGALLAVLCAGCGVGPETTARPLTAAEVPPGVLVDSTSRSQPAGEREERLYFVQDGRLVPVRRPAVQVTPQTVLMDLLAGPLVEERARGLTTALPPGPAPLVVQDGLALVDLGDRLDESARDDPLTALAQVVLSLTDLPEVDAVQFVRDGVPVDLPRGDGEVVDGPLRGEDYRDLVGAP